jgi:hypothetical protein
MSTAKGGDLGDVILVYCFGGSNHNVNQMGREETSSDSDVAGKVIGI